MGWPTRAGGSAELAGPVVAPVVGVTAIGHRGKAAVGRAATNGAVALPASNHLAARRLVLAGGVQGIGVRRFVSMGTAGALAPWVLAPGTFDGHLDEGTSGRPDKPVPDAR